MTRKSTYKVRPEFVGRVWGKTDLRPWYGVHGGEKIGEAWLTGAGCVREDTGERLGEYPLLVKMLFPDDKLSVQVHPDDAQAKARGHARGKTECWYVLEAEAGAVVACGLRAGVTVARLREAIAGGTAEEVLEMVPVVAGDMVFVDAGTVHAIGPGVTLLEVQQTCDVTYRLYDYGRARELHLEAGLGVVKTVTRAGKVAPREIDGFVRLIESEYFVVDRYVAGGVVGVGCLVGIAGEWNVDGVRFGVGECVVLEEGGVVEGSGVFVRGGVSG